MSLRLIGLHVSLALLASSTATLAHAAPDSAVLTPEDEALLSDFDRFGLPNVSDRDYVRVWTGKLQRGCCRGRSEVSRYGFLLEETDAEFRVLHDVWPVTYAKAPGPLAPGARAPRYQKADFKAIALKPGRRGFSVGRLSWGSLVRSRARPGAAVEFAFLARAAWQRGLTDAASKLLVQARTGVPVRARQQRGVPQPTTRSLEARLVRDLPAVFLWAAVESCGQSSVSRTELLERFRLISTEFPTSSAGHESQELVEVLELMTREDDARSTPQPLASLELDGGLLELRAPVEDLAYELRDLSTPAIHAFPHGRSDRHLNDPTTASSRLLALGSVATPALVQLCDDRRLTRLLDSYPRRGPQSATVLRSGGAAGCVLRYRDVALQILSRQAGRTLATKEDAAAWWSEVEQHGEVEVLQRAIRAGGSGLTQLARRLRELDPEGAVAAVIAGVQHLEGRDRERLVSYIATQKNNASVDAFLLREVREGPDLRARLTAARTLERRGCTQWSEPLVGELARLAEAGVKRHRRTSRDVIRFIVPSGNLYALEALRRSYTVLSVDERRNLLESAARVARNRSDRSAVCEAILVRALSDTTHWPHTWSWNGVRCVDSQLSDMAAVLLAGRLGQSFDPAAAPFVRARRIAELQNACRTSCGLPPVAVPEDPTAPTVEDPLELEAALFGLRYAATPLEITLAKERLKAIGLPALTRLSELVEANDLDPSLQGVASKLLAAIASTVREVKVTDASGRLTEQNVAALKALVGKPLAPAQLKRLIAPRIKAGGCHLYVAMYRDGQGRGVTLEFDLKPVTGNPATPHVIYALRTGKRFSRSSLNMSNTKQAKTGWTRFEARMGRLLLGSPKAEGELRLRVGG